MLHVSYYNANLLEGLNVKIIIGITHEPAKSKEYLFKEYGNTGTSTEVGPFLSKMDALNWLVFLKSRIGDFEEIIPRLQTGKDATWHGFTYERPTSL